MLINRAQHHHSKIKNGLTIIAAIFSGFFVSCDEPGYIGFYPKDPDLYIQVVDTFTVQTSTVWLDSIPTSGNGDLMIGRLTDPLSGQISSEAYFRIAFNASGALNLPADAIYDSISFKLKYNGYYYGDTSRQASFSVYRLAEDIVPRRLPPYQYDEDQISYFYKPDKLYNTSTFAKSPLPLGIWKFNPRPGFKDSLFLPIDQHLGREWFDLAKAGDDKLSKVESFLNYFKGLVIVPDPYYQGSIFGIQAENASLVLHYRKYENDVLKNFNYEFPIIRDNSQFNKIELNPESGHFNGISRGRAKTSRDTGNTALLQAGTGLAIRIEFPGLDHFREVEQHFVINLAELIVEPIAGTYTSIFPLPAELGLLVASRDNVPVGHLSSDYSDHINVAKLQLDDEFHRDTRYVFPVTSYIHQEIRRKEGNRNPLLLISAPDTYGKSFNRLSINGNQNARNKITLRIFYSRILGT
ncbi:MAG: DUF4270 family protein [Cyclobacteriaceae bacterium]|nr:DUF4270 family protein [Cyclobacteriaceae bacterium]